MRTNWTLVFFVFFGYYSVFSQQIQKQMNEGNLLAPDSLRSIIPVKRQELLRNTDLIFHTRFSQAIPASKEQSLREKLSSKKQFSKNLRFFPL